MLEAARPLIELGAAVVTAVATGVLAVYTFILSRETRRLAEVGRQASIVFQIEPTDFSLRFLNTRIRNTGAATAFDVDVSFDPPLQIDTEKARAPITAVSVLNPDQEISAYLCTFFELRTKRFRVTTSWKTRPSDTKRQSLSYDFDLKGQEGLLRLGKPPLHEIADAAESMAKSVERLVGGSRLNVDTFDRTDRFDENEEQEKAAAAFNAQFNLPEYEP